MNIENLLINQPKKVIAEVAQKEIAKSQKSRVKVYDTIMDALKHGYVGQIFSTRGAKRLYVITRRKWGQSGQQEFNGKVAKGFSPGTIPSDWKNVKKYSTRTMQRYGSKLRSGGDKINIPGATH